MRSRPARSIVVVAAILLLVGAHAAIPGLVARAGGYGWFVAVLAALVGAKCAWVRFRRPPTTS
jgi:hypothetical protein